MIDPDHCMLSGNIIVNKINISYRYLSYDVASGSEVTFCTKIDKPLMNFRYMHEITSITMLRASC